MQENILMQYIQNVSFLQLSQMGLQAQLPRHPKLLVVELVDTNHIHQLSMHRPLRFSVSILQQCYEIFRSFDFSLVFSNPGSSFTKADRKWLLPNVPDRS